MALVLRWLAAVVIGIGVFEGLDLAGSSPVIGERFPVLTSLPAASPFLAGAASAWAAGPAVIPSLCAAAAAVWVRIGVDRALGALHGAHPPAEADIVLMAFGVAWSVMAVGGGVTVLLVRWILRRRAR